MIILINGQKSKEHQVLAYFTIEKEKEIKAKGPIGKFFSEESIKEIMKICNAKEGDSIFLACGKKDEVEKILSLLEK